MPALKQESVNAKTIEMMSLPSKMQEEMVSQFPCYICNGTGQFVKGIETTYGFAAGQEAKIELEHIEALRSKQKKDQRKRFVQSTSFFQQGPIGEDVVAYDDADWDSGACVLVYWFWLYGRVVVFFALLPYRCCDFCSCYILLLLCRRRRCWQSSTLTTFHFISLFHQTTKF